MALLEPSFTQHVRLQILRLHLPRSVNNLISALRVLERFLRDVPGERIVASDVEHLVEPGGHIPGYHPLRNEIREGRQDAY